MVLILPNLTFAQEVNNKTKLQWLDWNQGFLKSKEKAEQPSNTDNEDKEAKNASEFFEMTIAKATPVTMFEPAV